MGLLRVLRQSRKKSKAMRSLILALEQKYSPSTQAKIDCAFDTFFSVLLETDSLCGLLAEYGVTKEILRSLMDMYYSMGFRWQGSDYIPVSVLSFYKPLHYLLENYSTIKDGSHEEEITCFYEAANLLH